MAAKSSRRAPTNRRKRKQDNIKQPFEIAQDLIEVSRNLARIPSLSWRNDLIKNLHDYNWKKLHAPVDFDTSYNGAQIRDLMLSGKPLEMVVLAVDIRKSTLLMKEAVDPKQFAALLDGYTTFAKRAIRENQGWFDKFTGDGLLAYWPYSEAEWEQASDRALKVAAMLQSEFKERAMNGFRSNSKSFPAGVGISCGIDAGPAIMAFIAGSLTIIGSPVVGAVRMVSCAEPFETVCNVYLGEALFTTPERSYRVSQATVSREYRQTKEYAQQEVYPVKFHAVKPSTMSVEPWKIQDFHSDYLKEHGKEAPSRKSKNRGKKEKGG